MMRLEFLFVNYNAQQPRRALVNIDAPARFLTSIRTLEPASVGYLGSINGLFPSGRNYQIGGNNCQARKTISEQPLRRCA
jgi:hypothetical protein